MSDQKKILWKGRVPDELRVLLSDSDIIMTQNDNEATDCQFKFGVGAESNTSMNPVSWDKFKGVPQAHFNEGLLEWDIPKLVLKRVFAGEGALGSEENYKGVLLKGGTVKIMNPGSFGHYSDLLAAFPSSLRVNPVLIRSFVINLLSYIDYLAQSELVSYPLDVDYGVSQDCFFVQVHCDSEGLFFENILDSTHEYDPANPSKSLVRDTLDKTDLLEIYSLKSSNKFVVTGCWIGNPNFMRSQSFPSLLLYQLDSYRAGQERKGKVAEIQSLNNHSIDSFSRIKLAEALPKKYKKEKSLSSQMMVNPVLVKRVVSFIKEKYEQEKYMLWDQSDLKSIFSDFPDQEAIKRINEAEEFEIINVLRDENNSFEEDVEKVKEQIPTDDYVGRLVDSLQNMSFEEVVSAAELEIEEEDTVVKAYEDDVEENQSIRGVQEDLTEPIQRIQGSKEDLTEPTQRVQGEKEDLTEPTQRVQGEKEDLTEPTQRVQGEKEDLTEPSQLVKGDREDLTEDKQLIGGKIEGNQSQITKIAGEGNKESSSKKIIKGEKDTLKSKQWEVKRLSVAEKIKEKAVELKSQGLSNKEIDENVKMIISKELGISEDKSEILTKNLSDDVSDDLVNDGIDILNQNIKQRFRLEKIENQLGLREKQVLKMKQLIEGLKRELGATKGELAELKESRKEGRGANANFDQGPINEEVARVNGPETPVKTLGEEASSSKDFPISDSETVVEVVDESLKEEFEELTQEKTELKAKTVEQDRELSKLKNELVKLQADKEVLLRKVKEGTEEVQEIRNSDEDSEALKKKNEALESQVESLKNRMTFMYENSKANKDIAIGANEVQKVIEDKERYFKEKMETQDALEQVRAEVREKDRIIKQKDLEIQQKSDLLKNKPVGEELDAVKDLEKEKLSLEQTIKAQAEELKSTQLKAKSFEQKVKFLNAQLTKFQNLKAASSGAGGSVGDPKAAAKLKQAEKMSNRFKEAADKLNKELIEKKAELHKEKLECKARDLKIKDLEKKLLQLAKKKAA